ncbi:MAG: SDR family NAD(P)-dependent oxidoreductase [Deltaproteobacteria bacterium]|nr:SDR family NAD(P)-dependent oxidoreductase [Deltaproteobacteria bacterium]
MKQLRDRVAVVTGAASGIGAALAAALAEKGCHVALVDRNEDGLREAARHVEATGRKASIHVVDVADREAMRTLPDRVVAEHGHIHIVVNNAGVDLDASFEDSSLEDLDWIFGINFWGVIYGCKFFLPHLRREEEAHIVNLSSLFGIIGVPNQSAYCTSKYAVRGLSESLWSEISKDGIGVTTVHPGGIKTNIARSARHAAGGDPEELAEAFDRMARTSPAKAAAKIVRGIERNAMRVRITPETWVFDWMKRIFPTWTQALIRWGADRIPGASGSNSAA